ncbi:MAG: acyl dehydratase [Candidatus Poriferisodalaceae bacterium]|jgi:acyl dehydratase
MSNDSDPRERFFEDFSVGEVFELGSVVMDEVEMVEFAHKYDPQAFHTDPVAAAESPYGGLIASGWLTGSLAMRLLADGFLGETSLGAAGIDELRWSAPVRAGDRLQLRVTVMERRESGSMPDRGFMRTLNEMVKDDGTVAMSTSPMMMLARRTPPESPSR